MLLQLLGTRASTLSVSCSSPHGPWAFDFRDAYIVELQAFPLELWQNQAARIELCICNDPPIIGLKGPLQFKAIFLQCTEVDNANVSPNPAQRTHSFLNPPQLS